MEPSHTPGPWYRGVVSPRGGQILAGADLNGDPDTCVATVHHVTINPTKEESGETLANTKLIAAAPDLLAALEMIESAMRDSPDFKDAATTQDGASIIPIAVARAAIAKAKGQ